MNIFNKIAFAGILLFSHVVYAGEYQGIYSPYGYRFNILEKEVDEIARQIQAYSDKFRVMETSRMSESDFEDYRKKLNSLNLHLRNKIYEKNIALIRALWHSL